MVEDESSVVEEESLVVEEESSASLTCFDGHFATNLPQGEAFRVRARCLDVTCFPPSWYMDAAIQWGSAVHTFVLVTDTRVHFLQNLSRQTLRTAADLSGLPRYEEEEEEEELTSSSSTYGAV